MRKKEKIIIAITYVIVLGMAAYLILASLYPEKLPFSSNTYTIKASDSKIFDKLSSFYIEDSSVLGDKIEINGQVVRPITSAKKFNIVFVPKVNIPKNTEATLELNLMFEEGKSSDIYLNNELIFPNLENYELIKETTDDYIYVKKDLLDYIDRDKLSDSDIAESFIADNFPSTSVWSTRKLEPVEVRVEDYKKEDTLITGTFRDNLKLAVYAKDVLSISFVKQDLNSYIGKDEYTVTITNNNGKVVNEGLLQDDGVKVKGSLGREQYFTLSKDKLPAGVYYIEFKKDEYNDAADSTVKNIKINSNKVLIVGNFLPWDKFEFYTKANYAKNIGFYYWWPGKDQIIKISGSKNENIDLNSDWKEKKYDLILDNGDFYIKMDKGYIWVYSDLSTLKMENWFKISQEGERNFSLQKIVVISKDIYNLETKELNLRKSLILDTSVTKTNFRILEPNIVNLNFFRFELR